MLASRFLQDRTTAGRFHPLRRMPQLRLLFCGMIAVGSTVGLPLAAQSPATPPQTTPPVHHRLHKKAEAVPASMPAPPPQPTVAPSLFEQPPAPATVTAAKNQLMVKAENSSLTQILHQVSSATGMRLDGLNGDERVFGSFGPGAPRDVLTTLLNGTSYNVVMVGDLPNGAPRELFLSSRATGGASQQPEANANPATMHTGDEDSSDDSGNSDDSEDTPPPMQYTPPSIAPATPPTPQAPQRFPQLRGPSAPQ
jgi:hypothetical protein